jgi:hypothetical protein
MSKIIFVPGFFENPWMPRYRKFRQELKVQHPEVDLDIVKMRWFFRIMTDYINATHKALTTYQPEVAGGFSYGANALLIAVAKLAPEYRPKRIVLASMSNEFAEELRYSEWHPTYMKQDLKKYHLGHIAEELGPTTEAFVIASDKEVKQNNHFGRHIHRSAEKLPGSDKPIIVESGTSHPFNMASPIYRQQVIDLLTQ